jgi:hypothetical protein
LRVDTSIQVERKAKSGNQKVEIKSVKCKSEKKVKIEAVLKRPFAVGLNQGGTLDSTKDLILGIWGKLPTGFFNGLKFRV